MKKFSLVALLFLGWLSGCQSATSVTQSDAAATPASPGAIVVTYVANEGFMIAGGGKKLLIDALFRESDGNYAAPSPATRELLEQARSPFDNVDAVFDLRLPRNTTRGASLAEDSFAHIRLEVKSKALESLLRKGEHMGQSQAGWKYQRYR